MKKTNRILILILSVVISLSVFSTVSFAANYATNYSAYTAGTVYYKSPVMKNTSSVKYFQRAINYCIKYKGLKTDYLNCDSSFGPACKKACIAFQHWANTEYGYKLDEDGSFGPASQKAMKNILNGSAKKISTKTTDSSKSKTLNINWDDINKTGAQPESGPCGCYAVAYCRDIKDGKSYNWSSFSVDNEPHYYTKNGATKYRYSYTVSWAKGSYKVKSCDSAQDAYKAAYDCIEKGEPVVFCVKGGRSSGTHYIAIVGYTNVSNINNLSAANFLIIDSAKSGDKNSAENMSTVGYSLKTTNIYVD